MSYQIEPDLRAPQPDIQVERRTHASTSGLVVAVMLAVIFVAWTWFIAGPLKGARIDQMLNHKYEIRQYADVLHVADRIGQRAVCLPLLGVVTAVVAWRHRSARPVLISVAAVLAVNLIVLVLKLWLGRGTPLDHRPGFFINGQMYPSGHTSNIVAVYGTAVYLISRYTSVRKQICGWLAVAVVSLGIVMTVTSVLLRWHWFGDLIAGYLVGGVVLAATVAIDRAVPFPSRRAVPSDEAGTTADDPAQVVGAVADRPSDSGI